MSTYDRLRQRGILFGPQDCSMGWTAETWEMSGDCWSRATVAGASPPARDGAPLAYDPGRGRTILTGGWGTSGAQQDVWEWDGTSWTDVTPSGTRPILYRHSVAFDEARSQLVAAGGGWVDQSTIAFWELDCSPDVRPALAMTVDWAAAAAGNPTILSLAWRAVAGGRGYSVDLDPTDGDIVGEPQDGVDLLAWDAWSGQWRLLDHADAPPDGLAPLSWSTQDPAEARRFLLQRDGKLVFKLRPTHPDGNGPRPAEVVADSMEAVVRYQLALPDAP